MPSHCTQLWDSCTSSKLLIRQYLLSSQGNNSKTPAHCHSHLSSVSRLMLSYDRYKYIQYMATDWFFKGTGFVKFWKMIMPFSRAWKAWKKNFFQKGYWKVKNFHLNTEIKLAYYICLQYDTQMRNIVRVFYLACGVKDCVLNCFKFCCKAVIQNFGRIPLRLRAVEKFWKSFRNF